MKKLLIALMSVIMCVALAVGLTACSKDDVTNPDGTPKNMAETIIDFENSVSSVFCWGDSGNTANGALNMGTLCPFSTLLNEGTNYYKFSGFTFAWKNSGAARKYKITKLEFDITSQTSFPITLDCNFSDAASGEYLHLNEISIDYGLTVHIVFDNLNVGYSKFAQGVHFKNDGRTTDKSVLNWQIKISNLFITAEKV